MTPKRLELLSDLVPQAKLFGLLVNPDEANPGTRELEEAARAKGLQLPIVKASSEGEIAAAFATLADLHADALVIGDTAFFTFRREQLVALAARYRLPTIERWHEFAAAGGLISYGPSLVDLNRQVGIYVGRILKGEKPADLPVQQPTKFELVINLKTANALSLTVPLSLLTPAPTRSSSEGWAEDRGYFEETKMPAVKVGEQAEIYLLDGSPALRGHVQSIARGITDRDNLAGPELLVNPNPTFEWVRLAQRILVRIHIDDVPKGVLVSSGMTAAVAIKAPPRQWATYTALRGRLACDRTCRGGQKGPTVEKVEQ